MTHSPEQPAIDAALASMSRWDAPPTVLWQAALNTARPSRRKLFAIRPSGLIGALAACVFIVLVVGVFLPNLGKARSARVSAPAASMPASPTRHSKVVSALPTGDQGLGVGMMGYAGDRPLPQTKDSTVQVDRMVVRSATVELKTRDVRAAFAKAGQVPSEANGEYIEDSTLSGEGDTLQGSLTLRVSARRLSTVLNQLRELAEVTAESSGGEDVTEQFVDIEARLRNEQRVEAELLDLLASRKDAPLKEVLDLRDSLGRVRESIERMTVQKERLSRLVPLATVLVLIRNDSTKPPPIPDDLGGYFQKQLRVAWQSSLTFLADSVALLVRVVVGGAVFWLAGLIGVIAVMAARRRAKRRLGEEPAPSV